MNTRKIVPKILVAAVLACGLFSVLYTIRHCGHDNMWYLNQAVGGRSYDSILAACREMIAGGTNKVPDELQKLITEDVVIVIYPNYINYETIIPEAIKKINVKDISVTRDAVLVRLKCPGRRIMLIAFKNGAEQFGSIKLIDGLWFWNGKRYGKDRPKSIKSGGEFGSPEKE